MLDSTGFAQLVATQPFMFHLVWNASQPKLESILDNGLERTGSHYGGYWASRPGHVYLGAAGHVGGLHLETLRGRAPYDVLRIDVSLLDRSKINPDEDHFLTHNFSDDRSNWIGDRHVCSTFHREFPPSQWIYEWGTYLGLPVPSLGEWADAVGLGADPAEVRYSIRQGSIAYKGVVPAAAIRLLKTTRKLESDDAAPIIA